MKVEVKKVDALKRELKFEISKDRVKAVLEEIYTEIGQHAKIRGYRPGKAPRSILVQSHGRVAEEETIKKIIPEAYREAVEQEKLEPIDLPEVTNVSLKDGLLTFTATLDIRPEVKLGTYRKIKVTRAKNQVTDEEINKTLDYFKKGRSKEGQEVTLDDNFAKGMGFGTLEEFKKALVRQLEMDKERTGRIEMENQIVDELIKASKLVVPQSLVKRQLERRLSETLVRLEKQGMAKDEITKKRLEIEKELGVIVERDVRVYLILEAIAEAEKIESTERDQLPMKVMEFLMKEADWLEPKK